MPKISVIIPVYKAEKTLRKCVESLLFGEEQDLEIILIDDCSEDGSWTLCQKLERENPRIKCFRNERNSGVSYTRNHGLDVASGEYVLFVDSDDWVSGSYAKTLIETQENHPGKLVVCGYTFIDHTTQTRMNYVILDTEILPCQSFYKLSDAAMMRQLWNKVYKLDIIRKFGIRFNEAISMGEDYQFVLDVIEAIDCKECVIIDQPLYYYIRWCSSSLMGQWTTHTTFDEAVDRVKRMEKICGSNSSSGDRVEQFKYQYAFRIIRDDVLPKEQKLEIVRHVLGDKKGTRYYRSQRIQRFREKAANGKQKVVRFKNCVLGKIRSQQNSRKIRAVRRSLTNPEFTIISQNCIGGVFSHDMGVPFQSPTVNLYFPAEDFIKFVNNLEYYLNTELELAWGEEYPVGKLDDIRLYFVHYETCQEARESWERRRKRVDLRKIVVLSTDRDGFNEKTFEKWTAITYPKLLFTTHAEYAKHPAVLYLSQYADLKCVPDLIPKREFYKDDMLIEIINGMGG